MRSPGGWRRLACVSLLWGVAITALLAGPVPLIAAWAGLRPRSFVHPLPQHAGTPRISDTSHESAWWVETWRFHCAGDWIFPGGDEPASPSAPPYWVIRDFATPYDRTYIAWFGTTASGWPLRVMSYLQWEGFYYSPKGPTNKSVLDAGGIELGWRIGEVVTNRRREALVLPLRPIWPGLATDVAFWSFAVFSARLGVRWLRARRRRRRGLCEVCAYPRTGLPADRACPECGTQP